MGRSLDCDCLGAQVGLLQDHFFLAQRRIIGQNELEKPQAHTSPIAEVAALKKRMGEALTELQAKESHLTVQDVKYLPFRCAATLISAPKVGVPFPSR